jgi:ribosome-binding factor A
METNRQKKIAGIIQKDIAEIIQNALRNAHKGVIVSVTEVKVTPDMMEAKVYLSVFPSEHRDDLMSEVLEHSHLIRHQLASRIKNQMRRVPELHFLIDDSLDIIEGIDKALKGDEINPITHPDILPRRKKM